MRRFRLFDLENKSRYGGARVDRRRTCGLHRPDDNTDNTMPDPELFDSLPYLLAQAHRNVHGALDRVLREENVPVEQWRILTVLSDGEGRAMSELSRQVLMNLPALSKTVDRMVSAALVHRKQDPVDSRRVLVFITDFGLELVARCNARVGTLEKTLTEKLGSWETERLCRLLKSLAD